MPADAHAYFDGLFRTSLEVIDALPLTIEPQLMEYISGPLAQAVEAQRAQSRFMNPPAAVAEERRRGVASAAEYERAAIGLNTLGMLLDRLSILAAKHWNLVHRAKAPDKAAALVTGQVEELIRCLSVALPGQSSINNKMTAHAITTNAHDFADAYHGLLSINLLLWEAQEILYNHDISRLPESELRSYITFFSKGNLSRNGYIQQSDQAFWWAVDGGANHP